MNFDFSDDLEQVRAEARSFLKAHAKDSARKALEDGTGFDRALWAELGKLGWIGAAIPEEFGGSGLGEEGLCVLAEEIGHSLAATPFASSAYLAAQALMRFGSAEQKARHLPGLADGSVIGCFALAEGVGAPRASGVGASVQDGRLHGAKHPVIDGSVAHIAIVAVRHGGEIGLAVVDLAQAEVSRAVLQSLDPSRDAARIDFNGAQAEMVPGAQGFSAVEALLDRAAVLFAFEQLGGAQACLEMARDYALERQAFGRPIGSFQAIKHKLADVYVAIEIARSNAYYGAWAVHTSASELPIAASVARISACEAGWFVTKENIQTHGGMGFTWQMDCHLYYRRAKLLSLALGGSREWKHRLVNELRARNTIDLEAA